MYADYRHTLPWLWGGLLSLCLLAGCATPAGRQTPRTFLAMSDGPAVSQEPTRPSVQGYNVPGRSPTSQAPWEFFLGNAAHRLIAYMYGVNHPQAQVFYNNLTIPGILRRTDIGDPAALLPGEQDLRPDITDVSSRSVFEIKPWNQRGLQEGLEEVAVYLAALNRTVFVGRSFSVGVNFHGEILIRFAQGQYIWRLEWQTTEPGVTQYRWTRSQQRFESAAKAADAGQWVELSQEELQQYGGWVGQAVEGMVNRREQLATLSGAVGLAIDILGESAKVIITGAIFSRMRSGTGAQPPAQGGGQVIPFPARPGAPAPPAQVPAAAMGQ